jgi:hypothetical protein
MHSLTNFLGMASQAIIVIKQEISQIGIPHEQAQAYQLVALSTNTTSQ